jgi:hypothetical protein
MDDFSMEVVEKIEIELETGETVSGYITSDLALIPTFNPHIYTQSGMRVWGLHHVNGETISDDSFSFGYFVEENFFVELSDDADVCIMEIGKDN